jgi:aspartate-semialdehyde dehydrogenase
VWRLPVPVPGALADQPLVRSAPRALAARGVSVVFGGLPSGAAGPLESELARRGLAVFTNAADHRSDPNAALLVPEVNPHALARFAHRPHGVGPIVANPNCTATGLALALAPVWPLLRARAVHVATYQAVSGAGATGAAELGVADNVLPFIDGEEEKVAAETGRLLAGGRRGPTFAPILVHAARVPVRDGHLEAVTVEARARPRRAALLRAWSEFRPLEGDALPTAPVSPVLLRTEPDRPQPVLDLWAGTPERARGMAVTIGRVRWDPPFLRFFVLSHNAVRGGAGGSVLNAELAQRRGLLGEVSLA